MEHRILRQAIISNDFYSLARQVFSEIEVALKEEGRLRKWDKDKDEDKEETR